MFYSKDLRARSMGKLLNSKTVIAVIYTIVRLARMSNHINLIKIFAGKAETLHLTSISKGALLIPASLFQPLSLKLNMPENEYSSTAGTNTHAYLKVTYSNLTH
jgi:hypothetical protein